MGMLWLVFTPFVFFGFESEVSILIKIIHILLDMILTFAILYIIVYVLYPSFFITKKYILFFSGLLLTLFFQSIIYYFAFNKMYTPIDNLFPFIILDAIANTKTLGIFLGILLSKKYYETEKDNIMLEKENKANQLKWLKSQIDPHFLFNNLNALDDLIDRDPQSAKKYLHKLSTLYRYLISNQEDDIISLQEEWDFIDNYIYLIQERYGKIYQFEKINQLGRLDNLLIPPASLQGLVENAVKHNQGSVDDPLKITITVDVEGVSVGHLKRPKRRVVESTGTGLKNLSIRYELLSNQKINIRNDEVFKVTLPHIQLVS